jgi:hypothetical protein
MNAFYTTPRIEMTSNLAYTPNQNIKHLRAIKEASHFCNRVKMNPPLPLPRDEPTPAPPKRGSNGHSSWLSKDLPFPLLGGVRGGFQVSPPEG